MAKAQGVLREIDSGRRAAPSRSHMLQRAPHEIYRHSTLRAKASSGKTIKELKRGIKMYIASYYKTCNMLSVLGALKHYVLLVI